MINEVKLAASLAKIRLSEEELVGYAREFEVAFDSLKALVGAKADGEPLVHGIEGVSCILREDVYAGDFGREELLKCAPDVQDDCFAVPRILE